MGVDLRELRHREREHAAHILWPEPLAPSVSPSYPSPWTKADVKTASQSAPLATITAPTYTFTVKKGDAFNRDFKFHN